MGVDFEQEIREIFGTTDLTALREISKAANEYQHMVEKSVKTMAQSAGGGGRWRSVRVAFSVFAGS